MKTIEDLLAFYNVEIGKTYRITKIDNGPKYVPQRTHFKIGRNFTIILDKDGCPLIKVDKGNYYLIDNLMYIDYVGVDHILDETERRYLSNIIKPFRDRIRCIVKRQHGDDEYILIGYQEDFGTNEIVFPSFPKGTMYKGIEMARKYTLEQLGL